MLNKIKQISGYVFFSLLSIITYWFILYFLFKWLIGYSLLHAYFGNLALILLILAIDESMQKTLHTERFITQMKQEKDPEKSYRSLKWALENFGSFKADLYLFYVFLLIGSQIIDLSPTLVSEDLGNFILSNNYSILILIAFDMLIGQFAKDRKNARKALARVRKSLREET